VQGRIQKVQRQNISIDQKPIKWLLIRIALNFVMKDDNTTVYLLLVTLSIAMHYKEKLTPSRFPRDFSAIRQGRRENSEAPGQKSKMWPPASETSRKFPGSRSQLWSITPGLLYEVPQALKH